jgi:hypothetical protein
MADIAHALPAIVTVLDGSSFGFDRPGMQQTAFISGRYLSRDWHGYNVREYELDPSIWQSGTTALEQWSAFWHHINGGADEGYIVEPLSETHRELICGGLGDGTKTTFPVPVYGGSSVTVFVDGLPQESSAYTFHAKANLHLYDTGAHPSSTDDYGIEGESNTIAISTGVAATGLSSAKVTAGGTAPALAKVSATAGHKSPVTAGETYTIVCPVLATAASNQYKLGIRYYTAANAYVGVDASSALNTTAGTWTVLSFSAAADATSAYATTVVYQNATEADVFYVGGFALCPGDYDRWHLPSQCPGLVEFAAAPASGARITATATGRRIARCRFEPGSRWSRSAASHATSRSIRAIEVVEF